MSGYMYIDQRVRGILDTPPPWPGFTFKVVESPDGVFILVAVEELAKFSDSQQQDISYWLTSMCTRIRQLKVPCYIQEWIR